MKKKDGRRRMRKTEDEEVLQRIERIEEDGRGRSRMAEDEEVLQKMEENDR